MVKSSKGFRSRSRGVLTKEVRLRGSPPPTHYIREFPLGTKVIIRLEASEQKGMPHPRYQGFVGRVIAKRGRAYEVEFKDGGKSKIVVSDPVHLSPLEQS